MSCKRSNVDARVTDLSIARVRTLGDVPLIAPIIFLCVGASRLRKASATPGHASMRRSIAVRSSATGFGGSGASDACLPLPFGEVIVVSTPVAPRIAAADAAASPQSKPKCAASLTQCSECIT